jgi:hypothetical protein
MFVWNATIGLGFVSRDDVFAPPRPTFGCGDRRDISAPFIVSIIGVALPIVNVTPSCS